MVHQRGLAGVGIADQRDGREGKLDPLSPLQGARALDRNETPFQRPDPLAPPSAVDFQLGFPGTARPDPAAEAGEMAPAPGQARQEILELGQLDLKLAFVAPRPLGEDIEDQLAPVDHSKLELRLQITLLCRTQIFIKNHQVRFFLPDLSADLLHFSPAYQSSRAHPLQALGESSRHRRPGAAGQLFELVQIVFERNLARRRRQIHPHQNGLLLGPVPLGWGALQGLLSGEMRLPNKLSTVSSSSRVRATLRWTGSSMTVSPLSGRARWRKTVQGPGYRSRVSCSRPSSSEVTSSPRT